tara:strand:- start:1737 stop:2252 length:516 start_codon:yes stop_codon:yes gene_type:complete
MSYSCKECKLKFETEAAYKLHISVIHSEVPKKVKKSTKKKKEPLLTIKGEKGYLSPDGKHVIAYLPDGKSKSLKDYAKKMRTDFPDIKLGDKLSPKEVRDLFKHNLEVQKAVKGAKLEVTRLIENKKGIRRYILENKKLAIAWAEGPFPKDCKTKSLRGRHYIFPTSVRKK